MGDQQEIGVVDDKMVSNNSDRDKVLATVAATIIDFLDNNPAPAYSWLEILRYVTDYIKWALTGYGWK